MKLSQAKAVFWVGILVSAIIFLVLTYNSLKKMPERTLEDNLTTQVVVGKWVWQKHNCNILDHEFLDDNCSFAPCHCRNSAGVFPARCRNGLFNYTGLHEVVVYGLLDICIRLCNRCIHLCY